MDCRVKPGNDREAAPPEVEHVTEVVKGF